MIKQFLFLGLIILNQSVYSQSNNIIESVDQGWSVEDKKVAYSLSEGSELIPLKWFMNLENANNNRKFIDDLAAYGFIKNPLNMNGLPVGLSTVTDDRTRHLYGESQWVGVNCTLCHSGSVKIGDRQVLIDGGSSMFNIQNFENNLLAAVKKTALDNEKFQNFVSRLNTPKYEQNTVKQNLLLFVKEFGDWINRNHHYIDKANKEVPYGSGRMDGIGGPTNDLTCHLTDRMGDESLKQLATDPRNCKSSHPAVSLPHLWGMVDEKFVQWGGNVHFSLARNFGQSTGTYGKNWIENIFGLDFPLLKSTADVSGLNKFEDLYKKLKSPEWSQLAHKNLVPPINQNLLSLGKSIYQTNCNSCHSLQPKFTKPNLFGNQYWDTKVYSVKDVGVDSYYVNANLNRKAFVPQLNSLSDKLLLKSFSNETDAASLRGLKILQFMTAGAYFKKQSDYFSPSINTVFDSVVNIPEVLNIPEFISCRSLGESQPISDGIKSRSLEGIIWTAPYLHNGSVPTLYDLLTPAYSRPKSFFVGCLNYDITKMGYSCTQEDINSELFDTTKQGNGNQGHEYGVTLSHEEKLALIEFIKDIRNPARPTRKNNCY